MNAAVHAEVQRIEGDARGLPSTLAFRKKDDGYFIDIGNVADL